MIIFIFLVISTRITHCLYEKIVFGYKQDVRNSNTVYFIGTVSGVDLSDCVDICKDTNSCKFINYHRLAHVCGIIGQLIWPRISSTSVVKHPGYILGKKSEWTTGSGQNNQTAGCGPPPSMYMTTLWGNMYTSGSVSQYMCTSNGSLTARTVCQADGSWRDTNLQCITNCASPPVLHNAVRSESSTNVGARIIYTCTQPFLKTESITCQQNGTWSALTMQCIPDECYTSPHTGVYVSGSSCYKYISKLKQWAGAKANCESLGGYLVQVSGATEMENLWMYVETLPNHTDDDDSRRLYIGLTDLDDEGTFKWLDGTKTTYTKWARHEPSGGTIENCVIFATWNPFWYDLKCSRLVGSLCEFNLQ